MSGPPRILGAFACLLAGSVPTDADGAWVESRPVREILTRMSRPGAPSLTVTPDLAEEKVTVAVSGGDWPGTRAALAACLDAEWLRTADTETLRPTARRASALAAWREARLAGRRALAQSLREGLGRQLASGGQRLPEGVFSPTFAPEIYPVVRSLPNALIERALSRPNPPFNGSEGAKVPGARIEARALSAAGREALSRVYEAAATRAEARSPGSPGAARLRSLARDPSAVHIELWVNEPAAATGHVSLNLSLISPPRGRADYTLAHGSAPTSPIDLAEPRAEPLPPHVSGRLVVLPPGRYRSDRFLRLLAQESALPLASDYYTRPGFMTVTPGARRLADVISLYCRAFDTVAAWEGDCLILRSRDWVTRVDREPRARVADIASTWDGRGPTLAQALDVARQSTDAQLATLEDHGGPEGEKLPLHVVPRLRLNAAWLRAAALLGAADRAAAARPAGLFLDRLPLSAKATWTEALGLPLIPPRCVLRVRNGPPEALPDWVRMDDVTVAEGPRGIPVSLWRHARSY